MAFIVSDPSITTISEPIAFDFATGELQIYTADITKGGTYNFDVVVLIDLDFGAAPEFVTYSVTVTVIAPPPPSTPVVLPPTVNTTISVE